MKIAAVQLNTAADKTNNIQNALEWTQRAVAHKAEFIALPELFNFRGQIRGPKDLLGIGESIPGESLLPFMALARRKKVFILAGSIYEKVPGSQKVFNTSVLMDDRGGIRAKYRKINLFNAVVGKTVIKESKLFRRGQKAVLSQVKGFRAGLSVCYDVRFPFLYSRYGRSGAELLCVPSAFTKKTGRAHWELLLRARAIENLCYVIAPNQIGKSGQGVESYGNSMIIDPWGKIVARASGNKEEIIFADVSKAVLAQARKSLPGIAKR